METREILKKIWTWISHGDTAWGILKLICPTIGGVGGAIISWLASVHPLIWFFAISGGIAIGLFISNEIAARRIQKRLNIPTVKEVTPDINQKYANWMTTAIEDDVRDLPSCILIGEPHINWEHLEEREDAYIEFNFNIWSSSVHYLKISKQVEGNVHLRGDCGKDDIPLKDTPQITQEANQLSPLRRGKFAPLTIKQWLSFTVKSRIQTHYRRSQVEFDFSRVKISVVATLPDGSQGSTCRLPIPDTVRAQVPDHPNPS